MYPIVRLAPGKEHLIAHRHPWLFSGALAEGEPLPAHGSLVHVATRSGEIVATGSFSAHGSIAVRLFSFTQSVIHQKWLSAAMQIAKERRRLAGIDVDAHQSGYRALFGESDSLPGLVIDRYADTVVFQIATAGMDQLRSEVVAAIQKLYSPSVIVERSDLAVRADEKLEQTVEIHTGELAEPISFVEENVTFHSYPLTGQKTGFYLDQRPLRRAIRQLSSGKEAVNLFSYTGSLGIAALCGGAKRVLNVDSSADALGRSVPMLAANSISSDCWQAVEADVFQWLASAEPAQFDLVILDPPALIKSRKDIESGSKAYHFLNRAALRLLRPGGILVSSSCSQFYAPDDMADMLMRAAEQNRLSLDLISMIDQSPDHPVSLYFPESYYLKSFICRIAPID